MSNSTAKRPNRFLVELPPPLREGLDLLAEETGRKRQDLIREAIQDWLEKRRVLGRGRTEK